MRYLICILTIALAAPATGQRHSTCPDRQLLYAASDYQLPAFTDWYCVDKDSVRWTFSFTRTVKTVNWTKMIPYFDSEDGAILGDTVYSKDWDPYVRHRISGRDAVWGSSNRLRIEISEGSDRGHFIDIVFKVIYFD